MLGYGIWYRAWHPRRRVLILNETFLRHTEWRQQDAMVATLLCQVRLAQSQHLLLRCVLSVPVFWISMACLPFLQIWLFPITAPFTLVPELIFFLILMAISGNLRSFPPQAIFTLDRLSAFLTGDPLAVMVAMKLRDALSGQPEVKPSDPSRQKRQRTPPSTDQRMLKLAEVMRQEWPRAPQTGDPVPAIITVYAGPHLITAPFDQATSALPVPASPYGGKDLFHQQ